MTSEIILPADVEAERATLGSCLLNREAITAIAPWLPASDFYAEKHAWVYQAMLDLFDRGVPPDLRLVCAELTRASRLDAVGGIAYLVELTDAVPTSYHVEHYAELVSTAAVLRGLMIAGSQITKIAQHAGDKAEALGAAQAQLDALNGRASADDDLVSISAVVESQYMTLQKSIETGQPVQIGIPTGFRDLDEMTGGLHRGDLDILAARPSVGKSALAGCIGYNVARAGHRVGIFSLEMGSDQYIQRLAAIDSGVNLQAMRLGHLRDEDMAAYMGTLGRLNALPIAISDTPGATVRDIRARIMRSAGRNGAFDLIIIDYLQLMSGRRSENRQQEVSDISRGLKQLARELDVPILALSQLSRAVEGRTSHVPMLSDLRESGALEQDADIVAFIYREELYDKETDKKGIAELHIAKHRNGPIGVVPLRFDAATTKFSDLSYRGFEGY